MKIVKPYTQMMQPAASDGTCRFDAFTPEDGLALLRRIEWAARISHRSEDLQHATSYERFIKAVVMQHGDWSVVEHVSASVDMLVDRGITHELVRHRLFSYTQESTRFVNYEKKMPPSFIYPRPDVECPYCIVNGHEPVEDDMGNFQHRYTDTSNGQAMNVRCAYDETWLYGISISESVYRMLISRGWRPQEARSVFPNALASRIIVTGNLRSWRHFFIMRTTQEAHPQMRQVTIPLLAEFKSKIPLLFDDIAPNARQADNLRLPR